MLREYLLEQEESTLFTSKVVCEDGGNRPQPAEATFQPREKAFVCRRLSKPPCPTSTIFGPDASEGESSWKGKKRLFTCRIRALMVVTWLIRYASKQLEVNFLAYWSTAGYCGHGSVEPLDVGP